MFKYSAFLQFAEGICGDPDKIRTCDPQIRNLVLYPAELRDHIAQQHIIMNKITKYMLVTLFFFP